MLLYIFIIYYISMPAECLCHIIQVIFFVVDIHINLIKAVNKTKYIFLSHLDQHVTFPKPRWCDR